MAFFKNKHVVTATIVAPLLAVISYYAIDFFVGEPSKPAEAGQSYKLVEKPNCRYQSGLCGLKNGDFELSLSPDWVAEDRLQLTLRSEFPLQGVLIALVENGRGEGKPAEMQAASDDGLVWSSTLAGPDPEKDRLRLVASSNDSLWYGDVSLTFSRPGEATD